jgi:hypothetical protein
MHWTCDAVRRVLQPQPKWSGMVCTLSPGRISANFPKFGEMSVEVIMWLWSHMPIHNLRSYSNTSYMYDMNMGCSLKSSTAQSKRSGMVCTLSSGRILATFHKSGEMSVVVMVWLWRINAYLQLIQMRESQVKSVCNILWFARRRHIKQPDQLTMDDLKDGLEFPCICKTDLQQQAKGLCNVHIRHFW